MSSELATPQHLRYDQPWTDVEVLTNGLGEIRQILTPQALADVVTSYFPNYYEIRFYDPDDKGAKVDGRYNPPTSAVPFRVWSIAYSATCFGVDGIRIGKQEYGGAPTNVCDFAYVGGKWHLSHGGGVRRESREEELVGDYRVVTRVLTDANSNEFWRSTATYKTFTNMDRVVLAEIDAGDGASLVTTNSYDAAGRMTSSEQPDGSWSSYQYDGEGRMTARVDAWLDAAKGSPADSAKATYYGYTPIAGTPDDGSLLTDAARVVTNTIGGHVVGVTYYVHYTNGSGEEVSIVERAASQGATHGSASNLRVTTTYYSTNAPNAECDRAKSVVYADGRQDSYTYVYGTYTTNSDPSACGFTAGAGTYLQSTVTHTRHYGQS